MIDDFDGEAFGARIRERRRQIRLADGQKATQSDLAKAVGVGLNAVVEWEAGRRLPRDPRVLARLAHFLDVTQEWLVGRDVSRSTYRVQETSPAPPSEPILDVVPGLHVDSERLPALPHKATAAVFRYLADRAAAGDSVRALFEELQFFLSPATARSYSAFVRGVETEADRISAAIEFAVHQHEEAYRSQAQPNVSEVEFLPGGAKMEAAVPVPRPSAAKKKKPRRGRRAS